MSVFDRKENIVGKGENAGYQHFLLFTQCFEAPRLLSPDTSKGFIVWEWVKKKQWVNKLCLNDKSLSE